MNQMVGEARRNRKEYLSPTASSGHLFQHDISKLFPFQVQHTLVHIMMVANLSKSLLLYFVAFSCVGLFVGTAHADCVDVVKPLLLGQCRARPDTKSYVGPRASDGLWTYRCDYECWTGASVLEVVVGTHQDYESDEMNSLVCKGVSLDMIESSGGFVKQCRRTVSPFEIFSQAAESFRSLIDGLRVFSSDLSVRQRVVALFGAEMREVAAAYVAASQGGTNQDQRKMLAGVADDLLAFTEVFESGPAPSAISLDTFRRYEPYLRDGGLIPPRGTREWFVTTHLNLHRDLIHNLSRQFL